MKKQASAKHIYFFIGTTAELIKVMPVVNLMKKRRIPHKIISSGQNVLNTAELAPIFGKIKVDIAFEQKKRSHKTSMFYFAYWAFRTFIQSVLGLRAEFHGKSRKSTFLIVHGDTVSSLIGACIGRLYRLQVVHVESGLRSFSFFEPFPEEICRFFISWLSDIHFCPNEWSENNLKNVRGMKINTKKNVVIESLFAAIKATKKSAMPLELHGKKYFMLMMHRQEHILFQQDKSKRIFKYVIDHTPRGMKCVVVMHALTESFLKKVDLYEYVRKHPRVIIIPRQPYLMFARIMNECSFMISDGGSTQEEAYYLGKPCLILRNRTERIEGLNQNASLAKGNVRKIDRFMKDYKKYETKKASLAPIPSEIVVNYFQAI